MEHNILRYWTNIIPPYKLLSWEKKAEWITNYLFQIFWQEPPRKVFIEWPTGVFVGRGLAAKNSDSLLKLCFLIGRLTDSFSSCGSEVLLVPVQKWRGTIKKELQWDRAEKFFGVGGLSNHAGDAAGIARWLIKNNLWR